MPLDGPAPPRVRVAPNARANSWEDIADLSASLNFPLDEWQEQALEAAMGERADGQWASKFVGVSAPRQNGKSQLIVARALAGILLFDEKTIIISAHETDTARQIWKRLIDVIEDNPTLEARVTGRMDAINREYLAFGKGADKQEIRMKARGKSGVRGFSADCLLLDEAQILGKQAWGSIVPTMSARPNPQMWLFGTPPTESDDPFAFTRVREASLAKKVRHCWLEWSADKGDDPDDPETWAKANPSYGVRLSYESIADDRSALDDEQFAMERLGMWFGADQRNPVFGPGFWEKVPKVSERPEGVDLGAIGVAVSVDLERASIFGAANLPDGGSLLKLLQRGPKPDKWFVDAVVDLHGRMGVPVIIDPMGPAADFMPALRSALGRSLYEVSLNELKDACAGIYKAVRAAEVVHASDGGEPDELDAAVRDAVKRDIGDRWAWGRRKSGNDVSPLESATLALWGLTSKEAQPFVSAYADHDLIII